MDNQENSLFENYQNEFNSLKQFLKDNQVPPQDIDEATLIRFFKASKYNSEECKKKLQDYLQWRQKSQVDSLLDRPIYIERLGLLKLSQLFSVTTEERLLNYKIQQFEVLVKKVLPYTKGKQLLVILDMKGFNMNILSKNIYQFIQRFVKIAQDYYPEILGQLLIVNSPMLFEAIWNNIKPYVDEQTRKKITIIGSGYKDKLAEIIDLDNTPNFLGGKSNDCITKNIGPWNQQGENLFTKEDLVHQDNNNEDKNDQDSEKEAQQLLELRNALQGKVVEASQKPPKNPQKYENTTTQGAKFQVSDTPLNTQADEDNNNNYYPNIG